MHIPVLLKETLEVLNPQPGEFFIDGTLGLGGHYRAIEEQVQPEGRVLGLDLEKTGENFADLPALLKEKNLPRANGLLLDLGISSEQIDSSGRGFSFLRDEPLLMTMNPKATPARYHVNHLSEEELTKIIREFGEERYAEKIAEAIVRARTKKEIETTGELVSIIQNAVPKNYERGRIHPATRTFQALRIYTNNELGNLETALGNIESTVAPAGRVAIISFHSLEDRLVKNAFRDLAKEKRATLLTKKPITASLAEKKANPRSRSAKLRAIQLEARS